MEIEKIEGNTYYIPNNTNIGVYKINDNEVYLIDTGNDKDCGKKIIKILNNANLQIKGIINTHSNADHTGGNKVIQERTNCVILAHQIEKAITEFPILEPVFLYGSKPFSKLMNKFLCAKESKVLEIDGNLPAGLEYFPLYGHFFNQIGIKTSDNVYFLGDALASIETINKYHIFFLYDISDYLKTLTYLETLKGTFIISHDKITTNLDTLIEVNRNKIQEIADNVLKICEVEKTFEEIEKEIFTLYNLEMNLNQYYLVGSTLKAYITYLYENEKIDYYFKDNKMYWKKI